jgi:hypothetical protein
MGGARARGGGRAALVLLVSLLLHGSLLGWYALYQRAPATRAEAPVMSITLVAARALPRPPPRRRRDHIAPGPLAPTREAAPVVAQPAEAVLPADLMAAPFAVAQGPAHPGAKPLRPCGGFDDGEGHRPCPADSALPAFDLDRARGGHAFAFQAQRGGDMRRYREAASDESYPGLNCAIFQMKRLHLCNPKGSSAARFWPTEMH